MTSASALAETEAIPFTFLQIILGDLRRARLVSSQRGHDGGYRLARPPAQITVGEVVRAMDISFTDAGAEETESSPLVRGLRLEALWRAADRALWRVLDDTTLAGLVADPLPAHLRDAASARSGPPIIGNSG